MPAEQIESPFSNLEFLYSHLPARYRREDRDLFLKRFLQYFGDTLDVWDESFDNFYQQINADTADEIWIDWWMWALFGWAWYPTWFTLEDKRRLFRNMARHNACRGTARGIELWLRDFGIVTRVWTRPRTWGELVWGEAGFDVAEPLHLVVEITSLVTNSDDSVYWSDSVWGESLYTEQRRRLNDKEIVELVRYVWALSQEIYVVWRTYQDVNEQMNLNLNDSQNSGWIGVI